MMLWTFDNGMGERVWSKVRPPAWTDTMAAAGLCEAPAEIAAEFEPEAMERFRQEYGAPLHTVVQEHGAPTGTYKRNALVA